MTVVLNHVAPDNGNPRYPYVRRSWSNGATFWSFEPREGDACEWCCMVDRNRRVVIEAALDRYQRYLNSLD